VQVVLSAGPAAKETPVPDLAALTLEEAGAKLAEVGLTLGEVSGPEGGANRRVVASQPEAGQKVAAGDPVGLTLELALVEVPKVTGLSVRKATESIESAGLKVGRVRVRFDDGRPPWAILRQTPDAGENVEPGSVVELVRNEG
jgi:serine/threonine-protein kinase